ncbi:MAG: cytochrome ubiquinol oxidase subunit I [Candidatus Binataceae bacterium]
MTHLEVARAMMATSLGFHIIFAAAGIALPLMMVVAEWRYHATGEQVYLTIARRWARAAAILFAIGAVSGTVLSFELGLLWPRFMGWAGSVIGMPFSLEGVAFFAEAIFLGIYMYGWDRLTPRAHRAAGVMVAISGVFSAVFILSANAWMNTPAGFRMVDGEPVDIHPIAAMFNKAAFTEILHMVAAAYAAIGFLVAGIHASQLIRDRDVDFHRRGLAIALLIGGVSAVVQPIIGDMAAREVVQDQPLKLAAFECLFKTQRDAPLAIGGFPDQTAERLEFGIEIPYLLSILAYHDPHALVRGLDSFPREDWPEPLAAVHFAFQIMVGIGTAMAGLALWAGWLWWRRRTVLDCKWFLLALIAATPLGLIAIESGWVVTEVGRQPWIIYGVMRTAAAVTPMPDLRFAFAIFLTLYLILALMVLGTIRWMIATGAEIPTLATGQG